MCTRSAAATWSQKRQRSTSARRRAPASVLRRSTVNVARAGTTLMRLGCTSILPTVPTWWLAVPRAQLPHVHGDARRGVERVVAVADRGGAGVVGLAGDGDLVPGDALDLGDRADRVALLLEHRALLDVELDEGGRHLAGAGRGAGVADGLELVAEAGAVDGDDVEGLLHRHAADVDEAAEHVGGEAAALLVGEEGDGDAVLGLDVVVDERLDDLEPGEHAEVAVVDAAGAHGVDVGAGHHRRARATAGAGGHHVADGVDGDVEAEVAHPGDDEVAAVAVGLGEGQPAAAAVARAAHRAELAEPAQEALAVDPQETGIGVGLGRPSGGDRGAHAGTLMTCARLLPSTICQPRPRSLLTCS